MKIRTGFVSNSSSSSFVIYGKYVGDDVDSFLDEIKDKLPVELLKKMEECEDDNWEKMEELASFLGKDFSMEYGDDEYYLGVDWFKMGEDETPRQFKERIAKIFSEKLNINDVHIHEYCGVDIMDKMDKGELNENY